MGDIEQEIYSANYETGGGVILRTTLNAPPLPDDLPEAEADRIRLLIGQLLVAHLHAVAFSITAIVRASFKQEEAKP